MNIHSSANNYFRTAAHISLQQKVHSKYGFDLPGGILLWKAVGMMLIWGLPFILALNLVFSSLIDAQNQRLQEIRQVVSTVEETNVTLRTERADILSPATMKMVATEKELALFVPVPGQVQRM